MTLYCDTPEKECHSTPTLKVSPLREDTSVFHYNVSEKNTSGTDQTGPEFLLFGTHE